MSYREELRCRCAHGARLPPRRIGVRCGHLRKPRRQPWMFTCHRLHTGTTSNIRNASAIFAVAQLHLTHTESKGIYALGGIRGIGGHCLPKFGRDYSRSTTV